MVWQKSALTEVEEKTSEHAGSEAAGADDSKHRPVFW